MYVFSGEERKHIRDVLATKNNDEIEHLIGSAKKMGTERAKAVADMAKDILDRRVRMMEVLSVSGVLIQEMKKDAGNEVREGFRNGPKADILIVDEVPHFANDLTIDRGQTEREIEEDDSWEERAAHRRVQLSAKGYGARRK